MNWESKFKIQKLRIDEIENINKKTDYILDMQEKLQKSILKRIKFFLI